MEDDVGMATRGRQGNGDDGGGEYDDEVVFEGAKAKLAPNHKRRLKLLAYLLNAEAPLTSAQIISNSDLGYSRKYQSAIRMLERDKVELRARGIPVKFNDGATERTVAARRAPPSSGRPIRDDSSDGFANTYRLAKSDYYMKNPRFTEGEQEALYRAAMVAMHAKSFPAIADLVDGLIKLEYFHKDIKDVSPPRVSASEPGKPIGESLEVVWRALQVRSPLTLKYKNMSNGNTTVRRVEPYGLVQSCGAWSVVGYCHSRESICLFLVRRIVELALDTTDKLAFVKVPSDFKLADWAAQWPWELPFGSKLEVTVNLSGPLVPLARNLFGETGTPTGEGVVAVALQVKHLLGLVNYVMWLGPDARIVSPAEAVAVVAEAARATVEAHRGERPARRFWKEPWPRSRRNDAPRQVEKGSVTRTRDVVDKVLWILGYVANRRKGVALETLAEKVNCSRGELLGLLRGASEVAYPPFGPGERIEFDFEGQGADKKVFVRLDQNFGLLTALSAPELAALQVAAAFSKSLGGTELASAQTKLRKALPEDVRSDADSLCAMIHVSTRTPDSLGEMSEAIGKKLSVEFNYLKADGSMVRKHFEPTEIYFRDSNWYVFGYCLRAKHAKQYRLDLITDISLGALAKNSSSPLELPSTTDMIALEVRRAEAQQMIERGVPYANHGDLFQIQCPRFSVAWVARQVMLYGGAAVAAHDQDVRDAVAARAAAVLAVHSPPGEPS